MMARLKTNRPESIFEKSLISIIKYIEKLSGVVPNLSPNSHSLLSLNAHIFEKESMQFLFLNCVVGGSFKYFFLVILVSVSYRALSYKKRVQ